MSAYGRHVAKVTDAICVVIMAGIALAFGATVIDHTLGLRWGWDIQIIWLAPVIFVGVFVLRLLTRFFFRVFGALD